PRRPCGAVDASEASESAIRGRIPTVLASLALPVAIIAAAGEGERTCSTGTATHVSFEPPLVATALTGRTGRIARAAGEFSVSLLTSEQAELAVRAARPSEGDKFLEQEIPTVEPPRGLAAPGIAGSLAVYWCRIERDVGALLVGRVEASSSADGEALVRFRRRYRALGGELAVSEESAYPL